MNVKEIELHSAEPAGVRTIDEEADRPEAIHQNGNGVLVIWQGFRLTGTHPCGASSRGRRGKPRPGRRAQDALKEPDGASWASLKKRNMLF